MGIPSSGKAPGIERAIQSREIPQIKVLLLGWMIYMEMGADWLSFKQFPEILHRQKRDLMICN